MPVKTVLLVLLLVLALIFVVQYGDETSAPDPIPVAETETELQLPELSDNDFDWIAARIYHNEAAGQSRYLTYWGQGEDFPSFGIGHFIWFPVGVKAPFDEMFPAMVAFVDQRSPENLSLPGWMTGLTPFNAPWTNKQQFDQAWPSEQMTELRLWLEASGQLQARFIVSTFEQRWQDLALPPGQKNSMTGLLQKLAATPQGLFAIIDYYNFKGLGENPRERYREQGWGLVQVLEQVLLSNGGSEDCGDVLEQFRQAAAARLRLRVELSPPERNEQRWLDGWLQRLQAYVEPDADSSRFEGSDFRVRPYLQNPAYHAVTVSWFSNDKQAGQLAVWESGALERVSERFFTSSPVRADALAYHPAEIPAGSLCPMPPVPFHHELRVTGLMPGTSYHYRVSQGNDRVEGDFQTPAIDERALRFIVYGDSETEPESTGKFVSWPGKSNASSDRKYPVDQTTGYAENLKVIRQRQPAFVAIAGDIVQSGGEQRDWDEFWLHNEILAASTYIMPALGNHDYFGGPGDLGKYATEDSERAVGKYKTYFDLPGNGSKNETHAERYYVLEFGVISLVVIDTTDGQPHQSEYDTNWGLRGEGDGGVAPDWQPGSEQHHWLIDVLQRAQKESRFTFVMFHGAPWTSGVHGLPPGSGPGWDTLSAQPLQSLTPLFMEYGVDAVFNGHDEMYEHSIITGVEISPGGDQHPHQVHFYDIGIGGDGLRGPVNTVSNPHRVFLAHADAEEIYTSDGVLKDGGKHYGHLEINVEKQADGLWRAQLDPVYIFPLIDAGGLVVGFERRLYDDSSTLVADREE